MVHPEGLARPRSAMGQAAVGEDVARTLGWWTGDLLICQLFDGGPLQTNLQSVVVRVCRRAASRWATCGVRQAPAAEASARACWPSIEKKRTASKRALTFRRAADIRGQGTEERLASDGGVPALPCAALCSPALLPYNTGSAAE